MVSIFGLEIKMSANVYWQPVSTGTKCLPTSAPQRFLESLRAIGWSDGGYMNDTSISALRGLSVLHGGPDQDNPYSHLVEAIERHGSVRVWAEY